MKLNECAYVKHIFYPDSFAAGNGRRNSTPTLPNPSSDQHGDWHHNEPTQEMTYLVKGTGNETRPDDKPINYKVYRGFFEKCIAPTAPPIPDGRPTTFKEWGVRRQIGRVVCYQRLTKTLPSNMISTRYKTQQMKSFWIILYIFGILKLEQSIGHVIKAKIIFISDRGGSLIAGYPDTLMVSNVLIGLIGDQNTPDMPINNGQKL